ncbi:MAG: CbtA family protein [Rhizobium sp.]|nr:CbtA family protein [Rhizobium sp.]
MIVRYLLAALVAGLLAGALQTVVQHAKVIPLILEAEKYEGGATPTTHEHTSGLNLAVATAAMAQEAAPDAAASAEEDEGLLFGVSRTMGTLMANLVSGAGFALLLMAAVVVTGRRLTLANGALWGAAAWLVFLMLPAVGLPPELPGFPAAELFDRQVWWIGTVIATAVALYLMVLRSEPVAKAAGVVLMLVPHVIGAPQPTDITSNVPAILAAEFAVATLSAGLLFWIVLGLVMGAINDRWVKTA